MLDDNVLAVLQRLEAQDADERARGLPSEQRMRAVSPTTGRFLFSLVAPQSDCGVLEIGGSYGYSSLWLAAGVRYFSGRVVSIEHDPARAVAWRQNVADAGIDGWAQLEEGDAHEVLARIDDVFDVVFIDAEKDDYETYFRRARELVEPGALIVADNVLSHVDTLGAYSAARQSDPTLLSVTVPLDRGLELTTVLR